MLHEIASSTTWDDAISTAFGSHADATVFQEKWKNHTFQDLPSIRVAPSQQLGGAYAAYVEEWNVIVLSIEFLRRQWNSPSTIARAILEEIGHFLDAQINSTDSKGDEGAIFAALVAGEQLSERELQALRSEEDRRTGTLAGQLVTIEQANIIGTAGNDVLNGTTGMMRLTASVEMTRSEESLATTPSMAGPAVITWRVVPATIRWLAVRTMTTSSPTPITSPVSASAEASKPSSVAVATTPLWWIWAGRAPR